MKLSEFRRLVDKFDDEARAKNSGDEEIVVDIDHDPDDESKVGIKDIFFSKMSKNTVKLLPDDDNLAHVRPPKETMTDYDILLRQTKYFCPNCGKKVNRDDKYCRHCGQEIIAVESNPIDDEGRGKRLFRIRRKRKKK